MNLKTTKRIAAVIAILLAVVMVVTSFGWVFASEANTVYGMSEEDSAYTDEQLAFMKQLMDYIQHNYKDPVEVKKMLEGAYTGLFDSLDDPYSVYYLSESEKDSFVDSVNGEFGGVGVSLESREGRCVVVAPIAGSPAEQAGLRSGDVIVKVNGADVTGKVLSEIAALLRGNEGTTVTVTVDRDGTKLNFTLVRATIRTESVSYKMLENKIGYIQLTQFDNDSDQEFRNALSMLLAEGAKSFIVDVRNNSGGYVDTAAAIAETFMPAGPIVHFTRQGKTLDTLYASGNNRVNAPLALLINEGSASSTEILAGAWQDSGTAVLVGTTTYGKGVAQQVLNLRNGYSMKLSLYYFTTPKNRTIDKVGVQPDVTVTNCSGQTQEELQAQYKAFVPMSEAVKPNLGDTGLNVYGAQQRLALLGYDTSVTGTLDEITYSAIKRFQSDSGLYSYGKLDYTTRDRLDHAAAAYVSGAEKGKDLQLEKAIETLSKK